MIRFKCPKCSRELTVKDDLAGRQGKCPACQAMVTVPSVQTRAAPPMSRPAPAGPRPRKPVEEEVVEAEVIEEEEEIVDAEIVDPPKKARSRRAADEDEDEDEDRPRKKKAARDEDEDDDRPRKKKKSARDEDEDDEDEDSPKKRKEQMKAERAGWRRAKTGMLLGFISSCIYLGAAGIAFIGYLIMAIMIAAKSTGSGDFLKLFGYATVVLLLPTYILAVVGLGFTVTSSTRHGAMGLAIASLAVGAIALLCYLFILIKIFDTRFGAHFGFLILFAILNPLGALEETGTSGMFFGGFGDSKFILYVFPLMEVSRITLTALYLWAAGKCIRDEGLRSNGLILGITFPSVSFGMGLLIYVLGQALKKVTSPWPGIIILAFYGLIIIGMLVWNMIVMMSAKNSLEDAS